MERVSTATGWSRNRDELERFVCQNSPRARSRPIEDRSGEESGSQIRGLQESVRTDGAEDGSDVGASESQHQEVTESKNYQIAFEDEETVRWGDAEEEEAGPGFFGFTKKIIGIERSVAGCPWSRSFSLTTTAADEPSHYGGSDQIYPNTPVRGERRRRCD